MVAVLGNEVVVFRRYKRSVFRCSSIVFFVLLRNLVSRTALRFICVVELGLVAALLGNVLGGTPAAETATSGVELGTELGVIPTLGVDLGTVLGGTPMSGKLGTELGVIPTLGLELGTELKVGAGTGSGTGSASSSVTVSTIGRFSGSTIRGQGRRREENPDWKQWKLHHQIQYHLL